MPLAHAHGRARVRKCVAVCRACAGKNCKNRPVLAGFSLLWTYRLAILKGLLVGRHAYYSPYSVGEHVTFQVGDKVIYPNHGLGVVQGIETKTILGTTCGFYHLRMVANETTVLVPVNNVDGVGLRRAVSDDEIERLFGLLGDGKIDNHQNWKGRFKDNSDRMRTGSIYDVVEVLKSLTFLARSKNLSFREKRMLDRAKFLVVSEISEVSRENTPVVEEKVDRALERCFMMKNRSIARAKTAKATTTTRISVRRTAKAS
jgi:CarD family transcriptional regulator